MAHVDLGMIRHDQYFVRSTNPSAFDGAPAGVVTGSGASRMSTHVSQLQPNVWHSRIPFYGAETGTNSATMNGDLQSVMDSEITYAVAAGIDYWVFNFWPIRIPSGNTDGSEHWAALFHYAINKYLTSTSVASMKFALNVQFTYMNGHWYPASGVSDVITQIVDKMKLAQYKKVLGGRPLLYIHEPDSTAGADAFIQLSPGGSPSIDGLNGNWTDTIAGFNQLRQAAITAGLQNPYIIAVQSFGPNNGNFLGVQGAVDRGIADAMSSYISVDSTGGTWSTFATSAATDRATFLASGRKMESFVSAGWDARPGSPGSIFYPRPTASEWTTAVQDAVDFVNANTTVCETKTVLISAWNEITEGHYIVPTLADGDALVTATAAISNPTDAPVASFTAVQQTGTYAVQFTDTSA